MSGKKERTPDICAPPIAVQFEMTTGAAAPTQGQVERGLVPHLALIG